MSPGGLSAGSVTKQQECGECDQEGVSERSVPGDEGGGGGLILHYLD